MSETSALPAHRSMGVVIKGMLRPVKGKVGLALATIPVWKYLWHLLSGYDSVRAFLRDMKWLIPYLASWPGAFGLMLLGFLLLAWQVHRQNHPRQGEENGHGKQEPQIDDPKSHETCERDIRNLESKVQRLQERDQTAGIQISARDGQIEQLEARLNDVQWLIDVAAEEAEKIYRVVSIVDCQIAQHEFFRHDPYVEFSIKVWNRSVFDVALPDLMGTISFYRRELTGLLEWKERPREVTRGNQAMFTFRQRLTSDDVVHILNEGAHFHFGELEIRAEGTLVKPQRISLDVIPPNNQALVVANPKLKISATVLLATMIVNMQEGNANPPDALVTLALTIRNFRSVSVNVDSFQLEITINSTKSTVYAETGDIWEKLHVEEGGELKPHGKQLARNLAERLPLTIRQAQIIGHVQFIVPGMGAMILNHPAPFRLILTDTTGEKHTVEGLTGRREVEQVEIKKGDESR